MRINFSNLLIVAALGAASVPALAAGYGMAGCGLGSIVSNELNWSNDMVQIFATTTNGTAGSQTFGITTGTSNCGSPAAQRVRDAVQGNSAEQKVYLHYNLSQIKADAARGEGSYIQGLAGLFGCQSRLTGGYAEFAALSQRNHAKIFNSDDADVVLSNYYDVMSAENIGCGAS